MPSKYEQILIYELEALKYLIWSPMQYEYLSISVGYRTEYLDISDWRSDSRNSFSTVV